MIINLTPLGIPFYQLSNIQYSTNSGSSWTTLNNSSNTSSDYFETHYVNNKGWMLVIKKGLWLKFNKTLNKNVTIFLVGGGGGGGFGDHTHNTYDQQGGGAGGAGGSCLQSSTKTFNGNSIYEIVIGKGGKGGTDRGNSKNGDPSSITERNGSELLRANGGAAGGDPVFNWNAAGTQVTSITAATGGSGSNGGGSGGKGGVYTTNATSGSKGTLLKTKNGIGGEWDNKYYGSGGGGGSGGIWSYLHDLTDGNGNTYHHGEATLDRSDPGSGGTDSGGKGGGKVNLSVHWYWDSEGNRNACWESSKPVNPTSVYQSSAGLTNFGGGGGGGGSLGASANLVYNTFNGYNQPKDHGAYINNTGADGGSGVCIIYYEK